MIRGRGIDWPGHLAVARVAVGLVAGAGLQVALGFWRAVSVVLAAAVLVVVIAWALSASRGGGS